MNGKSNTSIKVGVDANELESRGVEYDSAKFTPDVPDYLGYILGLLMVWLVYTGYRSVATSIQEPIAKISEHAVTIKDTVNKLATPDTELVEPKNPAPIIEAPKASDNVKKEEKRSWKGYLNTFNLMLNRANEILVDGIRGWLSEDAHASESEVSGTSYTVNRF